MHISLFEKDDTDKRFCYFKDIDKRLISDSTSRYGRSFTKEDFYLYIKAHEYKHFSSSGTGLRNLVDNYVFDKKYGNDLDWDYIRAELVKLGMLDYERESRELAIKLFDGVKLSDSEKELLDYFIFSGTYGNTKNSISNTLNKNGGSKARYIKERLIPPAAVIKKRYPIFYRYKVLLPLLPLYRAAFGLIKNRRKVSSELKALLHS